MKFLLSLVVLCALTALASGLAVRPTCPVPLRVSSYDANTPPGFLGNVLHYNRSPRPENSGDPIGPYFTTDAADCTWVPNGLFRCHLFLFADQAHSEPIGDALIQGTLNKDASAPEYAYGCLSYQSSFTTLKTLAGYTEAQLANFRNTSTTICFRRRAEMENAGVPYANLVVNNTGLAVLTLWGSNGYDAGSDSFDGSTRFTGFDGRFLLECLTEPPIIVGCPCSDSRGLWNYDYDCVQNGVAVEVTSPGTCLSLDFVDLANNGNCLPQHPQ